MKKKRFLSLFTAFCLFASTWLGAFPAYAIAPPEEQSPANEVYQNGPDTTPPDETIPEGSQPEEPQPAEPGPEESQPEEQPPEIVPALFEVQPRAGEHVHPVCGADSCTHGGHAAVDWESWDGTDNLDYQNQGHYYIADRTTDLLGFWTSDFSLKEMYFCLNGQTITHTATGNLLRVSPNTEITLCDCKDNGKLTNDYQRGGVVYIQGNGTFTMYGGGISGEVYGVKLEEDGIFEMYGGEIKSSSTAGIGVDMSDGGQLILHPGVKITGSSRNLVIGENPNITFAEANDWTGTQIGISYARGKGIVLPDEEGNVDKIILSGLDKDYSQYFTSDDPKYEITDKEENGKHSLVLHNKGSHTHYGDAVFNKLSGTDSGSLDRKEAGNYYIKMSDELQSFRISKAWEPKDRTGLCLNGYQFHRTTDSLGLNFIIKVSNGTFDLYDCTSNASGIGKSGWISNDTGSGVQVNAGGTFNLHSGEIHDAGFGVQISGGTFNMTGGKISNNRSASVQISSGTANLTGGEISGGKDCGVWVDGGNLTIGGGLKLTGNKYTNTSGQSYNADLFFDNSVKQITINSEGWAGKPADEKIYIYYSGTVTDPITVAENVSPECAKYFDSDSKLGYHVERNSSGELQLVAGSRALELGNGGNLALPRPGQNPMGQTLTVEVIGGTTPYTYKWYDNSTNSSTGGTLIDGADEEGNYTIALSPGTHYIYCEVTDGENEKLTTQVLKVEIPVSNVHDPNHTGWTHLNGDSNLSGLTAGNYVLDSDLALGTEQLSLSANITICLNGHTFTDHASSTIKQQNSRTLNLCDCSQNTPGSFPRIDLNGSTLNMYGGKISGNEVSVNGGGVIASSYSKFNMYGGEISGNKTNQGGGGVYVYTSTFTMYGGSITDNTASAGGGGVYFYPGNNSNATFTLNGGIIKDNHDSNSADSNIMLQPNKVISIGAGLPVTGDKFGVSTSTTPTDIKPVTISSVIDKDYSSRFKSDNGSKYHVEYNEDTKVLQLAVGPESETPGGNKPTIDTHPTAPAVSAGESPVGKEIFVTATGTGNLSYQWKYNTTDSTEGGRDVTPNGNNATCEIPSLPAGDYWFWCEVRDGDSDPAISNRVKITIPGTETPGSSKPTINTPPSAPAVPSGGSPVGKYIIVEATSPTGKTLNYQWYYNTEDKNTGGMAVTPDGDSAFCKIPDLAPGTYWFYCVITESGGGTVTTNTVKVVIPPKNTGDKLDPGGTITTNDGKTEVSRTGDGGTVTIDKDKTDGKNTDTTITLPEDNKKGEVTVNKDTGEVTVPGGSTVKDGDGTDGGSGKPDVTIGEQGGTVTKDGEVKLPGGGTANVGGTTDGNGNTTGGTTITGGDGGTTVTPKDNGTADVGEGGKVKTDPETPGKGGTEITLPTGGNVNPGDGSITPDKDESGKQIAGVDTDGDGKVDTLIVLPGTEGGDADGDKIKPNGNGDGGVTVPNGTELSGGENGASVTLPGGGEVTPGGGVKPNGSVTTGEDGKTEVTLPEDGEIKGDGEGGLKVPGGTTIKNGETGSEITVGGENGGNGGTLNPEGGVDLPKGGTATIEGGENGKKTEITAGDQGSTFTPKEDGSVDVSGGTTVKTGENGAEITVGDNNGEGGTVNKEGEITLPGGGSATIGSGGGSGEQDSQTTITMPDGGGTVKPDESGNVEVPDGSKVKTETTGGAGGDGKDNTEVTLPNGGSVASGDGSITPDKDENGKQIAGVDTDGDGKVDTLIVLPGTGGGSTDGDKIKPNENGGVDVPGGTELSAGNTTGGGESGGSKVVVGEKGGSVNSEGGLDLSKDGTATIEGGKNGEKTEITAGENGGTVKPNGDGSADVSGSGTKVQAGGSGGDNKKPAITVDDKGGTVKPDGSLDIKDGASVSIDGEDGSKTTITAPGGSGKTTVTPKDDGTADVTPGTTVQTTPGGGSGQDQQGPAITVGEKGGNVSGEGQVTLPGEGTATVDNGQGGPKTEITAGENGGTVKPNDKGGLDVSSGTTVKTGEDGTKITVPNGGSLDKDGQVSAPKLEIRDEGAENSNPTIITAPDGGSVTADKDGSAQVPVDSTVSKESVDGKVTVVTVEKVNKVDANGDAVPDENGTVETDKDGTLTFPGGGVVTVKKGDKTAEIEIPAGGSICADSTGTSDVSGIVYVGAGENAPKAPGVMITLQQGNIKYMKTQSDENGGFLLLNVRKGFYNIVAEQGEKTVTRLFNSDGNEKTDYKLNLPSDNVSSVLEIANSDDAPAPEESSVKVEQAVVGGLNIEAELVKQAENADAVKVTMRVAAKAADKADNAAAIQGVARGKKLEYLEVTVVKGVTRGGSFSENRMDQTRTVFEIVIPFTDLRSKSNVTVYRHHNGSANVLNEITGWLEEPGDGDDGKFWADKETDTIHIYTNKFSTYAIGYDDENGGETPVDPKPEQPATSGGGSGGSSAGSSNVSIAGGVTGGRVTVSPTRPMAGQKVTVNVNPDRGYKLDKLTVTDQKGNSVELTMVSDNQYTFVMPAGKVTITPVFVRSEADGQDEKGRTFSDVLESAWYAQYVAYVTAHDLMQGYTDGRFGPNDSTTRGQIVTILYRAEGEPAVERMSGFTDVADTQYYARAVAWAEAGSIVKGYSGTQFGPEDKITREQLAAILYRYAKYKGYAVEASADLSAYADYTRISAYARDAMQWAVADGIMKGKDNSLLDPTGDATRAEVAAMLMRFLDR